MLASSPVRMNADCSLVLSADSRTITLLVRITSIARETLLRPVLIPLNKGLTGDRLFLIQKPTQAKLNTVYSLRGTFHFGCSAQADGRQWPLPGGPIAMIILAHAFVVADVIGRVSGLNLTVLQPKS